VLGRCEPHAQLGRELGDESDFATQVVWRQVQARVLAWGQHDEAEAFGSEAVEIAHRTDGLNMQGDALSNLGEVLAAAGRTDKAAQALERYEWKKNVAMAAQVRPKLDELRAAVS
jgi:hypothetical protein